MDRKKRRNPKQQLPAKDECEMESHASPAANSNSPSSSGNSGSLQSSVSQRRESSPAEMLEKQMSDMDLPDLPMQKYEQQHPGPSSGPSSLRIYTVSNVEKKVGNSGRKIPLMANHFPMQINVPGGVIYHYDVNFIFPDKKEVKKSERELLLEAIERLKRKYPEIFNHTVVFDGLKNVYTCEKLKFSSDKFEGHVEIKKMLLILWLLKSK